MKRGGSRDPPGLTRRPPVLHCGELCCTGLDCVALCGTGLHWGICNLLHCVALRCPVLNCAVCNLLHCVGLYFTVLHRAALCRTEVCACTMYIVQCARRLKQRSPRADTWVRKKRNKYPADGVLLCGASIPDQCAREYRYLNRQCTLIERRTLCKILNSTLFKTVQCKLYCARF